MRAGVTRPGTTAFEILRHALVTTDMGRLRSSGIYRGGRPAGSNVRFSCRHPLWLGSAFNHGFRRWPVDPGADSNGSRPGVLSVMASSVLI